MMLKSIPASDGFAIAPLYKYEETTLVIREHPVGSLERETNRFLEALNNAEKDIRLLMERTKARFDQDHAKIFEAHLQILRDPDILKATLDRMNEFQTSVDYHYQHVIDTFKTMFDHMDEGYAKERVFDLTDVSRRVLAYLSGHKPKDLSFLKEDVILVAETLTPSDIAQLDKDHVKGIATLAGGVTSHAAIMARSMEIPMVVGLKADWNELPDDSLAILDGTEGTLFVRPDETLVKSYCVKIEKREELGKNLTSIRSRYCCTLDNEPIRLEANAESLEGIQGAFDDGAQGIGLFRTEFLFLHREELPSEAEQYDEYRRIVLLAKGRPVLFRTLDIGGDKELSGYSFESENNPFLGYRGIRFSLKEPSLFKAQLRALLRASAHGEVGIMFPMVSTLDEFYAARSLTSACQEELLREGMKVGPYRLGMMIETPSAALFASRFAMEADFLSIGTNDLIQYVFAVDRTNELVSDLYQPFHPAFLRLLKQVIADVKHQDKPLSMCGELAANLNALPILLGLGLTVFSMAPSHLLKIKNAILRIDRCEAEILAEQCLDAKDAEAVLKLSNAFLGRIGLLS